MYVYTRAGDTDGPGPTVRRRCPASGRTAPANGRGHGRRIAGRSRRPTDGRPGRVGGPSGEGRDDTGPVGDRGRRPVVFRIGEVAKLTGLTTRTLRYWEELGLVAPSSLRRQRGPSLHGGRHGPGDADPGSPEAAGLLAGRGPGGPRHRGGRRPRPGAFGVPDRASRRRRDSANCSTRPSPPTISSWPGSTTPWPGSRRSEPSGRPGRRGRLDGPADRALDGRHPGNDEKEKDTMT